jgi:POT family proton-dependent oligopeptide transporter
MLAGLVIYILGGKYLPERDRVLRAAAPPSTTAINHRSTFALLFAVGLAVTVFRGAYEQVGNTVALWADVGIDRTTALMTIPMTWFQSLNPLLVFMMTPLLLARWRRQADAGRQQSSMRKMARGALIVAGAYLLLAIVALIAEPGRASWLWLVGFFVLFTLGELYILPTGLGLFARLAPAGFGATTVAAWFLAIFSGSLTAGAVGSLWGSITHARFFGLLTSIAALASAMLLALDRTAQRIESVRANEAGPLAVIQPEFS